jgi:hypothetical protein
MSQVLRYKTHESSNMAVAVRCTPYSAALHGKTRPDHVHTRAMAVERVDRDSGAYEARKDLLKKYSETPHPMSLLQQEMQRMKLRNHESLAVTATLSRLLTKQEPEEIGEETVRRSVSKGFTKSQGKTTTFSCPGPILPSDDSEDESSTPRRRISRIKARSKYLRGIQQFWPKYSRTHNAMSAATTGGRGSA